MELQRRRTAEDGRNEEDESSDLTGCRESEWGHKKGRPKAAEKYIDFVMGI